jgi:hypothetical protein
MNQHPQAVDRLRKQAKELEKMPAAMLEQMPEMRKLMVTGQFMEALSGCRDVWVAEGAAGAAPESGPTATTAAVGVADGQGGDG